MAVSKGKKAVRARGGRTAPVHFPVGRRALLGRINRRLVTKNQRLHETRSGSRAAAALGQYYLRDLLAGEITETHIDLETFARGNGALDIFEQMVEDE